MRYFCLFLSVLMDVVEDKSVTCHVIGQLILKDHIKAFADRRGVSMVSSCQEQDVTRRMKVILNLKLVGEHLPEYVS